jgi:hypothetical protein
VTTLSTLGADAILLVPLLYSAGMLLRTRPDRLDREQLRLNREARLTKSRRNNRSF